MTDSDMNLTTTMLASRAFDKILQEIQSSNLNFQLQMSPFSAQISIKKSLVKDRRGFTRHPQSTEKIGSQDLLLLETEKQKLVEELETSRQNHAHVVGELTEAKFRIKVLEELTNKPIKNESNNEVIESLTHAISSLTIENKTLKKKIKEQDDEINDLENNIKVKVKLSETLNKKLSDAKISAEKDKADATKRHKTEIKMWRKDLGEERKKVVKLEKKLDDKINNEHTPNEIRTPMQPGSAACLTPIISLSQSQTLCSICAKEIVNYKPKYFLGEVFNPACSDCDDSIEGDNTGPDYDGCSHSPQCVLRQPYPPPASFSMPTSMVSHWIPQNNMNKTLARNPSSISTLITHCVKLPNPGDSFLSMEEILEEIRNMFKNMWKIN